MVCLRCGRTYKKYKYLSFHQRNECGIERKFSCPICMKKFKRKAHVDSHLLTHTKVQYSSFEHGYNNFI